MTRKALALASLWVLTTAAALAIGRLLGSGAAERELGSVASFERALSERDELERARRISAFLEQMGPAELPGALHALEANNVGVTREEVRLFMLAWSRFDAPGAFAWARAWPTQWTDTLMDQAIYAWGLRDAAAALQQIEQIEESERKTRLRQSLLEGWLHGPDRAGAGTYIATIANPRQRGRLTFLLAAETMREGPEAVMRWAEEVPETAPNAFKQGAFYHASALVAREDPRRAAKWFEAHRMRAYSAGSLEVIARRWSEYHDPPALFEWLRSLPAEGERGEAIAAGFRLWQAKQPDEAEAWLSSALPDPALDPAIAELVRAHTQASPATALAWAARVEDESLRRNLVVRTGRAWRRRDAKALEGWLAANDLPADVKQSILDAGAPAAAARRVAIPAPGPAARR